MYNCIAFAMKKKQGKCHLFWSSPRMGYYHHDLFVRTQHNLQ